MSSTYQDPGGDYIGDQDADPMVDGLVNAQLEETPLPAGEPVGQPAGEKEPSGQLEAQPHELPPDQDPAFAKEMVVKDPKAWQRLNQSIAELTGKNYDEIKEMPFDSRLTALTEKFNAVNTELERLGEYKDFVGIKVDAPAEQWNPLEQINQLPSKYQDKLIDSVYKETLPHFTETVLSQPDKYPDELGLLRGATTQVAQAAYGRPVEEIDWIMGQFRGVSIQQVAQILQGNNGQVPSVGHTQTVTPTTPLYQYAQTLGIDTSDPKSPEAQLLAYTNSLISRIQTDSQNQIGALRNEFKTISEKTTGFEQQQSQAQIDRAHQAIDSQAEAARNSLLDTVTKGRLPEGKEARFRQLILNDARAALDQDSRAQTALKLAKEYAADGVEAKAQGQLGIYANRFSYALTEAAKTVLEEILVPGQSARRQQDQRKAAQRHLGTAAGQVVSSPADTILGNRRIRNDSDVGQAIDDLLRARGAP